MSASSLAESFAVPGVRTDAEARRWSLATRVAFRFVFCFFLLSFFPFPLDSLTRFALAFDEKAKSLTLTKRTDPKFKAVFNYRHDAKMVAALHKAPEREFLLNSRGFHWINETPFNR